MINWDNFYVFAAVSICLWLAGAVFALRSSSKSKVAIGFYFRRHYYIGEYLLPDYGYSSSALHYALWEKPACGIHSSWGIAGLLTYIRWKYRWILSFSTLLSTVFCDH